VPLGMQLSTLRAWAPISAYSKAWETVETIFLVVGSKIEGSRFDSWRAHQSRYYSGFRICSPNLGNKLGNKASGFTAGIPHEINNL
jgi:hypothetical protein